MSNIVPFLAPAVVTVPASSRLAVYSDGYYTVTQLSQPSTNGPVYSTILFRGVGAYTSSTFSAAASIKIEGGSDFPLLYSVGTGAFIPELPTQPTPGVLNATGTLTAALVFGGIVTSTTAAVVAATLDTGTIFDAAQSFAINDYVDWTAINTGGTNAFTVTASTGHTVVGAGAVAANTSGRFRTRKTAANTFVTYRLS
jgi:hypothetical protein